MRMKHKLFIMVCIFGTRLAFAACTSPAGAEGQVIWNSSNNRIEVCTGAIWKDTSVATKESCSGITAGTITYSGGDLRFCNGLKWISMTGPLLGSCSGTQAGSYTWDAGSSNLKVCDGTSWHGAYDPCYGKSIGQACEGTTALYAGELTGFGKYMVMPSGCADDTSDPTCSGGADTVTKSYNDGSTNWYDIPSITNHTADASRTTVAQAGDVLGPIIAAITAPAEGGVHQAAKYCEDMQFGGYDDWYLPAKSEMSFIYCHAAVTVHPAGKPGDDPDCVIAGGKTSALTGFVEDHYWTSTESHAVEAYRLRFSDANLNKNSKAASLYVRCVRRYLD